SDRYGRRRRAGGSSGDRGAFAFAPSPAGRPGGGGPGACRRRVAGIVSKSDGRSGIDRGEQWRRVGRGGGDGAGVGVSLDVGPTGSGFRRGGYGHVGHLSTGNTPRTNALRHAS